MSTTRSSYMTSTAKNCFFRSADKGLEDELNKAPYYRGLPRMRIIGRSYMDSKRIHWHLFLIECVPIMKLSILSQPCWVMSKSRVEQISINAERSCSTM